MAGCEVSSAALVNPDGLASNSVVLVQHALGVGNLLLDLEGDDLAVLDLVKFGLSGLESVGGHESVSAHWLGGWLRLWHSSWLWCCCWLLGDWLSMAGSEVSSAALVNPDGLALNSVVLVQDALGV